MTPAEIFASLQLTESGRRQQDKDAAGWLARAIAGRWPDQTARVIRRCPSVVAFPSYTPAPGVAVVELHALRRGGYTDEGGIATIAIDARHLEDNPKPRELALTIAGLLA